MNRRSIPIIIFLFLLVGIGVQLLGVFNLFLIPILWAVILAIVVHPLYRWFLRVFRGRKNLASLLVTLLTMLTTAGPIIFFSGTLVREALAFYGQVVGWIRESSFEQTFSGVLASPLGILWEQIHEKMTALNIEVVPLTVKFFQNLTNSIVGQMQVGAKNFLFSLFNYLVTIFALFFFLRDGAGIVKGCKDLFPMSPDSREAVLDKIEKTLSAVVRGVGLTGLTQGILAGLAFWILGVPYPLFLALLTAFLAFVPLGGAAAIWLPCSIYLYFQGHWGQGLILFLWGTLVISMVDNFLKPLLIGEKIKLPTIFLFFSILGGLSYYGFIGVFLGPVLLTLFLTLIQIYQKEYTSR